MKNPRVEFVESELNIKLPKEYADFLINKGFYSENGVEVYGYQETFTDINQIPCVIGATRLFQEGHDLPPGFIVIAHTGYENRIIALETQTGHVYEFGGPDKEFFGDFGDWFKAYISDRP